MTDSTNENDLAKISAGTLEHYERSADQFRAGTWGHDVSQNIDALLRHLEGDAPHTILDFGCGPGRDLVELTKRGHEAVGLEGTPAFVEMAREASGCEVLHQDFLALDLPSDRFDGVFANASLFHVPIRVLPHVLGQLRTALRQGGVLFASNPHGVGEEGWSRGRFGSYHTPEAWRELVTGAGFELLEEYYRPEGRPREEQPWLATVWRRTNSPG